MSRLLGKSRPPGDPRFTTDPSRAAKLPSCLQSGGLVSSLIGKRLQTTDFTADKGEAQDNCFYNSSYPYYYPSFSSRVEKILRPPPLAWRHWPVGQ
jgi:hypothetical protein